MFVKSKGEGRERQGWGRLRAAWNCQQVFGGPKLFWWHASLQAWRCLGFLTFMLSAFGCCLHLALCLILEEFLSMPVAASDCRITSKVVSGGSSLRVQKILDSADGSAISCYTRTQEQKLAWLESLAWAGDFQTAGSTPPGPRFLKLTVQFSTRILTAEALMRWKGN